MTEWDVRAGNLVGPFDSRARELVATSDAMDLHDVDSFDPDRVMEWRLLRQLYVKEALLLIELILANPEEIRRQLRALLRDH
jgi:hypothetical protein